MPSTIEASTKPHNRDQLPRPHQLDAPAALGETRSQRTQTDRSTLDPTARYRVATRNCHSLQLPRCGGVQPLYPSSVSSVLRGLLPFPGESPSPPDLSAPSGVLRGQEPPKKEKKPPKTSNPFSSGSASLRRALSVGIPHAAAGYITGRPPPPPASVRVRGGRLRMHLRPSERHRAA